MGVIENIIFYTQNSIRIAVGGRIIYIDPFRMTKAPKDADFVLVTHEHFDHFSPEDIEKVRGKNTVLVIPSSMKEKAGEAHFAASDTVTVKPGSSAVIKGLELEAIPAYNEGKPFHPKGSGWVGYILNIDGERVYIAGDTDATPEAMAVKCDIALIPIGGKYTMDAGEAAELVNTIRPKYVIPTHFGETVGTGQKPDDFKKLVDDAIKVKI